MLLIDNLSLKGMDGVRHRYLGVNGAGSRLWTGGWRNSASSIRQRSVAVYIPLAAMKATAMTSTGSDFTVRKLQPADGAGYLTLARQVDALHHRALPDRIRPPEEAKRTEAAFRAALGQPDTWLLGVEHDNELIGMAKVQLLDRPEGVVHHPSRTMIIDELAVHADWHRRGVGRLLMDHAVSLARSLDAHSVELRVYEFNAGAIAFYESFGMRTLTRTLSLSL